MPRDLRDGFAQHGGPHLPCRRHHYCDRRNWRNLWEVDEFGGVHGLGTVGVVSARVLLRERRVYSGSSDVDSGERQAAADVGIGAWRGWARVGSEDAGG